MSPDEFTGGPGEFYDFAATASANPTFYADLTDPQSLNKYQYCNNNPLLYVDPNGHQGIKEYAKEFIDSAASTFVRDTGLEKPIVILRGSSLPDVTSSAGATAGHALAIGIGTGELIIGGGAAAGGTAGAIATSPSGVGAIVGVGVAVGGVAVAAHGAYTLVQTLGNIYKDVFIDKVKYPETAGHVEDAQTAGHPAEVTVDRKGAKSRRQESLKGTKTKPGTDRDEYPPAVFVEGGKGASVRHVTSSDNRGAGSSMGRQLKDVKNGEKVTIKTK